MKPIILLSLFVFGIVSFAVAATPAHAQTTAPPTYEETLTAAEQSNLQYALDTLQTLLNQIQSRLGGVGNPINNAADVNATLGSIHVNLSGINTTVEDRVIALEESRAASPNAPALAQGNQPAPAPTNAFAGGPTPTGEAPLEAAQAASTSPNPVWWVALAVVIAGIVIYYWRMRRRIKTVLTATPTSEVMNTNEVTPNIRQPS